MRTKILKRYFSVVGIFFSSYILYSIYDTFNSKNCSDSQSKEALNTLCRLHLSGKAAGNLCPDLCSKNKVEYKKCANYRGGKQVLITRWDQITAVLKSKKPNLYDYDSIAYPGQKGPESPPLETFTNMIKDSIEFNFNVKISEDQANELPNTMWTRDMVKFVKRNEPPRILAAFQSLYSLIQQEEYLFVKYFQSSKHIPLIYGSCGHFYAMEYLPPGNLLSPALISNKASQSTWKDRVDIALGLLDLVYAFDTEFPHKLHMCDVKGENFGRGDDGMVKLIDTDAVFFEPKLKDVLVNDTCKVHDDCNFFDCKGFCNLRSEKCTSRRVNSNLQAICRKIFLSGLQNVYYGLLDNPPSHLKSRQELTDLLKYCSKNLVYRNRSPATAESDVDNVYRNLRRLLQDSI